MLLHLQTVESILTPSSAPALFVTGTPEVVVQAGQLDEAVALAKPFPVDTLCQVLIGTQTIIPSVADRRGKGGW